MATLESKIGREELLRVLRPLPSIKSWFRRHLMYRENLKILLLQISLVVVGMGVGFALCLALGVTV